MRIAKRAFAAIVVALALGPDPAAAAGALEGVEISATAYEPIPANAAFRVETENSSELTLQVRQLVRGHLRSLGYRIAEDSPLVLMIGTEAPETLAETRMPVKLSASKSTLGLRFFLFGTNSSGLLQESPEPAPGDFRISLSIHDQRLPGYLWRGVATTCRCGQGMVASSREMVPALVESIGQTVGPPPFESSALQ